MHHIIPTDETALHIQSLGCKCSPIVDGNVCLHLPLTINLYGITDKDAIEIQPDANDTQNDERLLVHSKVPEYGPENN